LMPGCCRRKRHRGGQRRGHEERKKGEADHESGCHITGAGSDQ
jgi:hypothetical protein